MEAFESIAKLDQKLMNDRLKSIELDKITEETKIPDIEQDNQLAASCQNFILNFCQLMASHYVHMIENPPK